MKPKTHTYFKVANHCTDTDSQERSLNSGKDVGRESDRIRKPSLPTIHLRRDLQERPLYYGNPYTSGTDNVAVDRPHELADEPYHQPYVSNTYSDDL